MRRFLLAVFLSVTTTAFAQLKWDKPWQEFHRTPDEDHLETKFTFKNTGTGEVTIKTIKTSCGCTTAKLETKTYAPGQDGELTARFNFGSRKGAHRKMITVTTEDETKQELNLVVFIHPGLNIEPALVFWKVGQPAEARTVQLTAEPGTTVKVKGIISTNPRLTATLQTTKAGESYVVSIKPADTAQRESAEFTIQTDYPPDAPRSFTLHARIK